MYSLFDSTGIGFKALSAGWCCYYCCDWRLDLEHLASFACKERYTSAHYWHFSSTLMLNCSYIYSYSLSLCAQGGLHKFDPGFVGPSCHWNALMIDSYCWDYWCRSFSSGLGSTVRHEIDCSFVTDYFALFLLDCCGHVCRMDRRVDHQPRLFYCRLVHCLLLQIWASYGPHRSSHLCIWSTLWAYECVHPWFWAWLPISNWLYQAPGSQWSTCFLPSFNWAPQYGLRSNSCHSSIALEMILSFIQEYQTSHFLHPNWLKLTYAFDRLHLFLRWWFWLEYYFNLFLWWPHWAHSSCFTCSNLIALSLFHIAWFDFLSWILPRNASLAFHGESWCLSSWPQALELKHLLLWRRLGLERRHQVVISGLIFQALIDLWYLCIVRRDIQHLIRFSGR